LIASGFYLKVKVTAESAQSVRVVAHMQERVKVEVFECVIIAKAEAKIVEV
jgi:hypothetical protein